MDPEHGLTDLMRRAHSRVEKLNCQQPLIEAASKHTHAFQLIASGPLGNTY